MPCLDARLHLRPEFSEQRQDFQPLGGAQESVVEPGLTAMALVGANTGPDTPVSWQETGMLLVVATVTVPVEGVVVVLDCPEVLPEVEVRAEGAIPKTVAVTA